MTEASTMYISPGFRGSAVRNSCPPLDRAFSLSNLSTVCIFPGLQDGNIVMIAVQRGFEAEDHGELLDALETAMYGSVTGTLELRNIHNDAFAMIFKKGEHVNYLN